MSIATSLWWVFAAFSMPDRSSHMCTFDRNPAGVRTAMGSVPNGLKPALRYRATAGSLPSVTVNCTTRMPPRDRHRSMAACSSARAAPLPRHCGITYMPINDALCFVLGFAENASATAPTSSVPSKAPNATDIPVGSSMRPTHQDSGSPARSSTVDVNASAACS